MKQGSTFVLVVDLQLDMSYVKSIIFTLKNKGKILTKENWSFEDGKFKIPFTQEETVQLDGRTLIEAQINFEDGNVAKSEIKEIFIKESLATRIVEGSKATEETQEIGLAIAGDVVYTGGADVTEELEELRGSVGIAIQKSETAIQTSENAEHIAKGRATGYVFDTLADLELALEDVEFTSTLVLGDNLYIRATDVPDYWWDGEQKQQLETQKVDLANYVTKGDLVRKLDKPDTAKVGQIFSVKAVNEDGTLVLEAVDMPSGGVGDVQVNGQSIIGEDGVAVIPTLKDSSYGLAKVSPYRGMNTYSDGTIAPAEPTNDYINRRNESVLSEVTRSFALTISKLDYGLKAAMCDGKGEAWTAEEKSKAMQRIEPQYELIEEIVLSDAISSLKRTEEPNGTPYNFLSMYITYDNDTTNLGYESNLYTLNNSIDFYPYIGTELVNSKKNRSLFEIKNGLLRFYESAISNNINQLKRPFSVFMIGINSITDLKISFIGSTCPIGTVIKLYGIRA